MENEIITSAPPKGFKGFLQRLAHLSWKAWLIIAVVAAIMVGGGLLLYNHLTDTAMNTYKTPLNCYIDYMNSRSYSLDKESAILNGFAEEEYRFLEICNRMSLDYLKEVGEDFEDDVEYRESEYGMNYEYSYKIEDKDELNSKELSEFESHLQDFAQVLQAVVEYTDDFDFEDWKEFAESAKLSLLQARLYITAMKNLYRELEDAEVTEGYALEANIIIKGSKLDEPEEQVRTIEVYKINGRWVAKEFLEIQLVQQTVQWMSEDMLYEVYNRYYDMIS